MDSSNVASEAGAASDHHQLSPLASLILAYAKPEDRSLWRAVFALDAQFGRIVRSTQEAMLGQIRFQWWHDVISSSPDARPTGNPLIADIAFIEQRLGPAAQALLSMLQGWERLLPGSELSEADIIQYAEERGGALFGLIAALDPDDSKNTNMMRLGSLWAQWDLARHCTDPKLAGRLLVRITTDADWLRSLKLSRRFRPMSVYRRLILADIAAQDVDTPLLRPATAARIVWHGLSGR